MIRYALVPFLKMSKYFKIGFLLQQLFKLSFVLILFLSLSNDGISQVLSPEHISLFGNFGIIETPTARFGNDKELNLSISYLPEKYRVLRSKPLPFSELHYNASIMFLPFVEITASLIRPNNISEQGWGIGDRGYKIRFLLLKENKNRPNIVFGIHDPMGANTHQGAIYFAASKRVEFKNSLNIDFTFAYAFNIKNRLIQKTHLFKMDSTFTDTRLSGIFGGIVLNYKDISLMTEYDTQKINTALSYYFFKHFNVQITLLGLDKLSFGFGFRYQFGNPILPSQKSLSSLKYYSVSFDH